MPWRPWRCPVIESSRCLSMQVSEEREFWETRRRSPSPPRERSPAIVFSLVAARSLQGSSRVRLWFCRAAWIGFFAILLAEKSLRRFSTRPVCLCGLSISRSVSPPGNASCWRLRARWWRPCHGRGKWRMAIWACYRRALLSPVPSMKYMPVYMNRLQK